MAFGLLLGLASALSSAIAHVLSKAALRDMNLVYFLKLRTSGAAAAMLVLALISGDYAQLAHLTPQHWAWIAAGGILSPWLISTLLFWSLERMPLNVNAPLFRSSAVFTLAFSVLLFGEKVGAIAVVGVLVVVCAVGLFSWRRVADPEATRRTQVLPVLAALLSAVLFGLTVSLWDVFRQWTSGTNINLVQCTVGSVFWIGIDACRSGRCPVGRTHLLNALLSGVLIFGLSNVFSILALAYLAAPVVTALGATSTLMIGLMAALLFGEGWDRWDLALTFLIVGGVALMAIG